MFYKQIPIRKRSKNKILRDEAGNLQLKILKLKRGDKCEFCGQPGQNIGRFHIMRTAKYPRLEFVEENILLSHYLEKCQSHYRWHHFGANAPECAVIENKIKELRGEDYITSLLAIERFMGRHDTLYLMARISELKAELKDLQ